MIKERNSLQAKAKQTCDKDDIEKARLERNKTNESIAKDKYAKQHRIFEQIESNDIRAKWKAAKEIAGMNDKQTPKMLIVNGKCHTKIKT